MCCRCRGSRDDRAPPGAGVCGECAALGVSDLERMVGMAMSDDWGKMMFQEKLRAKRKRARRSRGHQKTPATRKKKPVARVHLRHRRARD